MDVEPETTPTPQPMPAPQGTDSDLDAAMKEVSKDPEAMLKKLQGEAESQPKQ